MVKGITGKLNETSDVWITLQGEHCVIEVRELALRKYYDPMVHRSGLQVYIKVEELEQLLCNTSSTQHISTRQPKPDTDGKETTNK